MCISAMRRIWSMKLIIKICLLRTFGSKFFAAVALCVAIFHGSFALSISNFNFLFASGDKFTEPVHCHKFPTISLKLSSGVILLLLVHIKNDWVKLNDNLILFLLRLFLVHVAFLSLSCSLIHFNLFFWREKTVHIGARERRQQMKRSKR